VYGETSPHWSAELRVSGLGSLPLRLVGEGTSAPDRPMLRWHVQVSDLRNALQVSLDQCTP
jgi:hypothetical protein